jgi:hypothetical protein
MLNTVSCLTNLSYYLPVDEKEELDNESSLKSLVLCKFIPYERMNTTMCLCPRYHILLTCGACWACLQGAQI